MADNVTAPVTTGTAFATDDVSGIHYQIIKIAYGALDTASLVSATNPLPTLPAMASGGNISVQTNATGTTYTAFTSQACKQLTLVNNTGTTIEFRQGGAGVAVPVFDKAAFTIFGLTNTNQIDIRRTDTSNTQVTIQARWEA